MPDRRDAILSVDGLKTWFFTPAGVARAVDDVSFQVFPGDIVAIVGESGSGKSVTALSVLKLIPAPPGRYVGGSVVMDNRDTLKLNERALERIRGEKIGMIFQSPRASLDPSFRIQSQLVETIRRHDPSVNKSAAEQRARSALLEVGFPEPDRVLASYPHQLSGGMCQRIALAMTLACNPELLIADEPTTALDVGVQAKILLLLKRKNRDINLPIIIITHDFGVVRAIASRVIVMYAGQIQEEGEADDVLARPCHPYTEALIRSVPDPDADSHALHQIPGEPPNLIDVPSGCRFAPRCPRAFDRCQTDLPSLHTLADGRKVRCHLFDTSMEHEPCAQH